MVVSLRALRVWAFDAFLDPALRIVNVDVALSGDGRPDNSSDGLFQVNCSRAHQRDQTNLGNGSL